MKIVDLEDKRPTKIVVVILVYLVKAKGQGKNLY